MNARRTAFVAALLVACGASPQRQHHIREAEESSVLVRRALAQSQTPGCRRNGTEVEGVSLSISLAGRARSSFRQGERIVIALSFASTIPATYELDAREWDRSGRVHTERYHTSSVGAVDPLADHFRGRDPSLGGSGTVPILSAEPTVIERVLNEFVRFDEPGIYPLQVSTDSVRNDEGRLECVSQVIELRITPADPDADRALVANARAVLADEDAEDDEHIEAARTLRFLTSREAVLAAVAALAGEERRAIFELYLAIVGSPHRDAAIAALERALIAPDTGITPRFIETLVLLKGTRDHPGADTYYRELRSEVARALARSLPAKRGAAADTTFATLFDAGRVESPPPDWFTAVRAALATRLPRLDSETQRELLEDRWSEIADPSLVPALEELVDSEETDDEVCSYALVRLLALSVEGGRERILREIARRPHRPLSYTSLFALPSGPRPELDEVLVSGVERNDDDVEAFAALLMRYGSPAIIRRVRLFVETHGEGLEPRTRGFLDAYLLRLDGAAASRTIAQRLRSSSSLDELRAGIAALETAAWWAWHPSLEAPLIGLLSHSDREVVRLARDVLRLRGGAASQGAFLQKLRALHAEWGARASELQSVARSPDAREASHGEYGWSEALYTGDNWILTERLLSQMHPLCLTHGCRQRVERARAEALGPSVVLGVDLSMLGVMVSVGSHDYDRGFMTREDSDGRGVTRSFVLDGQPSLPPGVPRYRAQALDFLTTRVLLYPRSTAFRLFVQPEGADEARALQATLRAWLEAHGYRVTAD